MRLTESSRRLLEQATARYQADVDKAGRYLSARGITREVATMFRLGYVSDDSEYRGRLAIPYLTGAGVVDIRYRLLDGDGPKYLSRPGAKTRLYNVAALFADSTTLYVTEGEIDCISASMCGLPAVGVPGANNWQPHFKLLMQDYERVIVLCDGDEAGRQFGKTVAKEVDNTIPVAMPSGMDVNDVLKTHGPAEVVRMVEESGT